MMVEHLREKLYQADLAGIRTDLQILQESLKFNYVSYNANMASYLSELFGEIQHFRTDE